MLKKYAPKGPIRMNPILSHTASRIFSKPIWDQDLIATEENLVGTDASFFPDGRQGIACVS